MYTTTSFSCYNIFNFSCPFHTVLIPPGQGFQRNIYPVSYPAHGYSINDSDVRSFQRSYKKKTYFGFYAPKNEIPKNMGKILYKSQNGQNKHFNKVSTIVYLYPCVCTLLLIRPIYGVKCRYMARSEEYTTFQMLRGHYWALAWLHSK